MKRLLKYLFVTILFVNCKGKTEVNDSVVGDNKVVPVPIIFDTDISGDYDDVGAIGMLHAFADYGEIEILATMGSNLAPLVAPTIEAINTYFGRPDLPIGVPKTIGVYQDSRELHWPDSILKYYPHTYNSNDDAPDAVKVYRQVLSKQPDTSVTIVTVGFLTNLSNLIKSEPDSISPLNGFDLVRSKVKKWVAMGGKFPNGKEVNIKRDSTASKYAIDRWPTPIIFSGFEIGEVVLTGLELIKNGDKNSPIRMAYDISIPKRPNDKFGRNSWDQTALLVGARGFEPYYEYETGRFITSDDGSNSWESNPQGPHKYLLPKMKPDSVGREIEKLMMHTPVK